MECCDSNQHGSNDVTFSVYKKTFDEGAEVTLGTNGMNGAVVNYTVFVKEAAAVSTTVTTVTTTETTVTTTETTAAPAETTAVTVTAAVTTEDQTPILRGDVDCNQQRDVSDAVLLAKLIAEDASAAVTAQGMRNADCNANGSIEADDVITLLQFISKLIPSL